jgi:transposase
MGKHATGKRERIIIDHQANIANSEIAESLECSPQYVSNVIRAFKKANGLQDRLDLRHTKKKSEKRDQQLAKVIENMDDLQVETKGRDIRTAEEACDFCGVNLDEWRIAKKVVNFWDMGEHRNWQVKVWLDKKHVTDVDVIMERLLKRIPKFKYSKFKPSSIASKKDSGNMAIIANFDVHLGKLAWDVETGQGDYDMKISVENFNHVTDTNLARVKMFNPEKIIFILGQDMMHYENLEGVTPQGRNILDTDGRLAKLQDTAIDVIVNNILKCRAVAPVEVILVQGNHDSTSSLWLSKVIRAWFRKDDHVTVDCQPMLRKARLWGKTFIGLAHSILPSKMAYNAMEFSTNFKEMWGQAEYRECLFGHKHKKSTWAVGSIATHGKMMFRQLTALSPIDFWHYENMFVDAVPGGEALVYNKETGCIANFTEWTFHRKQK